MDKVMYEIPLEKLYKVIASCQYEEGSDFCPVLVKIIDPKIMNVVNQQSQDCKFLLQVWTIKGEMVFERCLKEPPANWNISGNKLIYKEKASSDDIYLVKLFLDKQPALFKI